MVATGQSPQRSDEIRSRRSKKSPTANKKASRKKRAVSERKPPPVMARSSGTTAAANKRGRKGKASKKAKLRYDVALNDQGVEMQLPALPQVRLGWRLASFLMVAALGYILYQLWVSPNYQVDAAEVTGLQRFSSSDVNTVLDVNGKPVFMLDADQMQDRLEKAFPEFSTVAVQVDFPQTVMVTVTERIPVIIWRHDGHSELVDMGGLAFPLRESASGEIYVEVEAEDPPPPLPLTELPLPLPALLNQNKSNDEGEESEAVPYIGAIPFLSPEMVSAILFLDEHAPEGATLTYSDDHGLSWENPGEWVVYYGDVDDIDMKYTVFQAIRDHLNIQDTRPAVISVEYVHAPYYRLEP